MMMFGTLVGVLVFSVMWSELLMTSAISCPLWSSVCECQREDFSFTSQVRTECVMFVMYCMQCCMFVSTVFYCMDELSWGGIYMFAIVIGLVLLKCSLTIWNSVLCVLMVEGMFIIVNIRCNNASVPRTITHVCQILQIFNEVILI